jgi:hypothetical protein
MLLRLFPRAFEGPRRFEKLDWKEMLQELTGNVTAPLSLTTLSINLGVGILLSLVLGWHFGRFGSTLSNRDEFRQVFPFVLLTTVLVISVVKSSLALSLGLVGALSIVRFRTPIKEPEELAYLFLAIAMGLGLGANQTVPTVIAAGIIMAAIAALRVTRWRQETKSLYLSIDGPLEDGSGAEPFLERLKEVIGRHVVKCDLRRYDEREGAVEATYFVDVENVSDLSGLTEDLRKSLPNIGVTFLDQSKLPSV